MDTQKERSARVEQMLEQGKILALEASQKYLAAARSGQLEINARGHFKKTPQAVRAAILGDERSILKNVLSPRSFGTFPEDLKQYLSLLEKPSEEFHLLFERDNECTKCGEILEWETNGKVLQTVALDYNSCFIPGKKEQPPTEKREPCPYANGLVPIVTHIDIPSGIIVLANDLREFFDPEIWTRSDRNPNYHGKHEEHSQEYSLSSFHGEKNRFELYATFGMGGGLVGNSSPGVYRAKASEKMIIGVANADESDEPVFEGTECIGKIDTALWWYTLADYAKLDTINPALLKKMLSKESYSDTFKTKVIPGTYKITHQYHMPQEHIACPEGEIFATIELEKPF